MLAFFAFPILALLTVWLLYRWSNIRKIPLYVLVPLFIAFFIPISTVALVPFDLVNDQTLDNHKRLYLWRTIYWVSFFLMWAVLPVLQAYVESGYHSPLAKFRDAMHYTLKYHLILLAAGTVGGIYVWVTAGLSFTSLKGLCIALSHSYGLVLVIWLLGHGAVNLPRDMWNNVVDKRLSWLYCRATPVHDNYADAQSSYDDVVAKVMALEPIKTAKYEEWIDSLIANIRSQDLPLSRSSVAPARPRDLNPTNLSELTRILNRDQNRVLRCRADWFNLLTQVQKYEQVLETQSVYRKWLRFVVVKCLAVAMCFLSVSVVWSEIVSGTKLSLIDIFLKHANDSFKVLLAGVFLGYMCLCVNSSLTSLRIFNLYAIVPRQTDISSLLFFGAYALRLTVPLSYNFLMLNTTQETVFQEFLGKFINLTGLGKSFNSILPRLIVIPMVLTMFNVYGFIKEYLGFGFGYEYIGSDEELGQVNTIESDGRNLVKRALTGFSQPQSSDEQESWLNRAKNFFSI